MCVEFIFPALAVVFLVYCKVLALLLALVLVLVLLALAAVLASMTEATTMRATTKFGSGNCVRVGVDAGIGLAGGAGTCAGIGVGADGTRHGSTGRRSSTPVQLHVWIELGVGGFGFCSGAAPPRVPPGGGCASARAITRGYVGMAHRLLLMASEPTGDAEYGSGW